MRAMSLIEIMVVITLIGLVTAVIGVAVITVGDNGREQIAKQQAEEVAKSCELFRLQQGRYPADNEGIMILVRPPSGRGLMKQAPLDPWGRAFSYALVDGQPQIRSAGADGAFFSSDDVGNW